MSSDFRLLANFITSNQEIKFSESFNWSDFFQHGNSFKSIFFSLLKSQKQVPQAIYHRLEQISEIPKTKNQYLLKIAHKLNQILKEHKVNFVFYKGIVFLNNIYANNISARTIRDIDILVLESDYEKVKKILISQDYVEDYSERGLGDNQEAAKWFEENHFHAIFKKGEIEVEIHKNISFNFLNPTIILERKVELNSLTAPLPEYQILIQILNFIHDQTINKGSYWYLENKSKTITYAFLALCYEVKRLKEFYNIDEIKFKKIINNSGEANKAHFVYSIISRILNGEDLDPQKALVSTNILFLNAEIPKTKSKPKFLDTIYRRLYICADFPPRVTPVGKGIFWLKCINQFLKHVFGFKQQNL